MTSGDSKRTQKTLDFFMEFNLWQLYIKNCLRVCLMCRTLFYFWWYDQNTFDESVSTMWNSTFSSFPVKKFELKRKVLKSDLCRIGQLFRADVINRQKRGTEKHRDKKTNWRKKRIKNRQNKNAQCKKQKRTRKDNVTK